MKISTTVLLCTAVVSLTGCKPSLTGKVPVGTVKSSEILRSQSIAYDDFTTVKTTGNAFKIEGSFVIPDDAPAEIRHFKGIKAIGGGYYLCLQDGGLDQTGCGRIKEAARDITRAFGDDTKSH